MPQCLGHRRCVVVPVDLDLVGARVLQGQPFGLALFAGVHGADFFVLGLDLVDVGGLVVFADQVLGNTDGARGVFHVHGGAVVAGFDFHGGVHARGGGAADQQRDVEAFAFHFLGDVRHFIQAGGDEPAQADDVDVVFFGGVEDFLRGHHDAEVDDFEVVALQHHADDVLADVVHVALDGGHEDLALGLGCLASFSASM